MERAAEGKYRTYWQSRCSACLDRATRQRAVKTACESCGYKPVDQAELEIDHVLPQHLGGKGGLNLQTLCSMCHKKKTILDADPNHLDYFTILKSVSGLRLAERLHAA